jgi:CheY-like chemotaxis protein
VLEAASGSAAIEVARTYSKAIHLLLADVVMPGMSGRDVARQLIAERPSFLL